jgi:tetratricopeptide (TPR) repeat protein
LVLKVSEINKAFSISPDLEFVNSTRGSIFQDLPDGLEEAFTSFRKAYEINPNNTNTLFGFALLLQKLGLTDERTTLLKKAIKLDPLNASYFAYLGGGEVHLNKLNDGIRDLQTAYRLQPDIFYAIDRIAYSYSLQNNQVEAKKWLEKFEKVIQERKPLYNANYGQFAAYCYAKLQDKKKALEISHHWRVYLALNMKKEALQEMFTKANGPGILNNDYLHFKAHLHHKDFDIIRNEAPFLQMLDMKKKQYEANKKRFSIANLEKK